MKGVYHIDLSNKFWKSRTTGIACIETESKRHAGCALCGRLKRYIEKKLYTAEEKEERAKLYAICIYYSKSQK